MKQRFELNENDIKEAIAFFLASRKNVIVKTNDVSLEIDPGDEGHYADSGPTIRASALASGTTSPQR